MQETDVLFMFRVLRIQFPLNNLRWENTGNTNSSSNDKNSNPEMVFLESEDDFLKTLVGFMNRLKNLPINKDLMFLPTCLRMVKKVRISEFEFEAWVCWQEEQARVNPNFHREYMKAIGRPRFRPNYCWSGGNAGCYDILCR